MELQVCQLSYLTEGLEVFHVHGHEDLGLPQDMYVGNMISASLGKFKEKLFIMAKIILGIHGLGNKPPKKLLLHEGRIRKNSL